MSTEHIFCCVSESSVTAVNGVSPGSNWQCGTVRCDNFLDRLNFQFDFVKFIAD